MSDTAPIIEQLQHQDLKIRISAVKALTHFGDSEAVLALKNTILTDESIAVRRTAILALGSIGGCEIITIVEALLEHPDIWIRKALVQAIGMSNCQSATPLLVNLLGDRDLDALAREALVALKVDPDFF